MMMFFRTKVGEDGDGSPGEASVGEDSSPPGPGRGADLEGGGVGGVGRPALAPAVDDEVRDLVAPLPARDDEEQEEDDGSSSSFEDDGGSSACSTEEAIRLMRLTDLAVDPGHYHAFRRTSAPSVVLSSIFSSPLSAGRAGGEGSGSSSAGSCLGCGRRFYSLPSLPWRSSAQQVRGGAKDGNLSGPGAEVLRCVSCGAHAHRGCAFSSSTVGASMRRCPVNEALVVTKGRTGDGPGRSEVEERVGEECNGARNDVPAPAVESGNEFNDSSTCSVPHHVSDRKSGPGETQEEGEVLGVPPESSTCNGAGVDHLRDSDVGGFVDGAGSACAPLSAGAVSPPPPPPAAVVPPEPRAPGDSVFAAIAVAPGLERTGGAGSGEDYVDDAIYDHDDFAEDDGAVAILVPRCTSLDECDVDDDESSGEHVWQDDGPPSHWAVEKPRSLEGMVAGGSSPPAEDEALVGGKAVEYMSSVSSVSRVLQENLLTFFGGGGGTGRDGGGAEAGGNGRGDASAAEAKTEKGGAEEAAVAAAIASLESEDGNDAVANEAAEETEIQRDSGDDECPRGDVVERTAVESLAKNIDNGTPSAGGDDDDDAVDRDDNGGSSPARVTLEIAKKTGRAASSIAGIAGTVGSVVGGVAGLALAGPLGFVVGSKIGQVCGIVGVVLQGGRVLVLGAGAVAAGLTVREAVARDGKLRVLTLGGGGGEDERDRLVLVRPYVEVDPMWDDVVAEIRRSAPDARRRTLFGPAAPDMDRQRRERVVRDADIVQADEAELGPGDKVTLLVSRGLNDKSSLPGHVYRCLIKKHRERAELRGCPTAQAEPGVECGDGDVEKSSENKVDDDVAGVADCRGRRQDAHAVILHVTRTLLEVRPGFGVNPVLTEMTATAVETLVFGELYDSVFEEIVEETSAQDRALSAKIRSFQNERTIVDAGPSKEALRTLRQLPEAHTAVDKLSSCVRFLELISTKYADDTRAENDQDGARGDWRGNGAIGADSLLILVCQHIIRAEVPRLNAELAFLEEFARDEYLLRGKEGYALVTLQASLHFLNASDDFERDIFQDDR